MGSEMCIRDSPTSIQALCQPIPKPKILKESSLRLRINETISPEDAAGWLVDNGFESVDRIDLPGQFARRGGIVDIYPPLVSEKTFLDKEKSKEHLQGSEAIRVEFFGDTIESIREVNLDTQRSSEQIKNIGIISAVCGGEAEQRELFVNIIPQDTIIIFEEPNDIEEVAKVFLERVEGAEQLYQWQDIYRALGRFTQLHICRFAGGGTDDFLKVDIKSIQQFQQRATSLWAGHKAALEELVKQSKEGKKVCLYCERSAEIERVSEIIKQSHKKVPLNFKLLPGFIHQGFVVNSLGTIIISPVSYTHLTLPTN